MEACVFTTNTCRILKNPSNISELTKWPNAVLSPDFSKVGEVPPHFWKLVDGDIVSMSPREIRYRKKVISMNGMDNVIRRLELSDIRPEMKDYEIIRALDAEYNQLKTVNYVYLGLMILNLLLTILLFKK